MADGIACDGLLVHGVNKGEPARGTSAGYDRHQRAGEASCDACRQAHAQRSREQRAADPSYLVRHRERRAANPEPHRAADKKWREANREIGNARQRRWRQENPDRARAYGRQAAKRWSAANPEQTMEWARRWAAAHPEERKLIRRRSRLKNAAATTEISRRRRARKSAALTIPFTTDQLDQRMSMFGHACWMCGGPFEHVDHVIAVARGGPHCLANLRPACKACNSSKSARDWREYVAARKARSK